MTTKAKAKTAKSNSKPRLSRKSHKKAKIKSKNLAIIICSIVAIAIIIIIIIAITLTNSARRNDAVSRYEQASELARSNMQEFGIAIGKIVATSNYSDYDWNDDSINSVFADCFDHFDYDGNSIIHYTFYDTDTLTTEALNTETATIDELAQKVQHATENVSECKQIIIAKGEQLKTAAEEKAAREAAEEAATKAEAERKATEDAARAERVAKYGLTYDKFINEIYEGMTIDELRAVYTGFDDQCKISSSSTGYEFYSCKLGTSYSYKTASFSFRNGRLTYKSQYGLN